MKPCRIFWPHLFMFMLFVITSYSVNGEMASAVRNNWEFFDQTSEAFRTCYGNLEEELLRVVKKRQSSNLNKCTAADYLGRLRSTNAVGLLAKNIGLELEKNKLPLMKHLVNLNISEHPAFDALIRIGNPSIPAMIRNLEESDDTKTRELSLKVIYQIDGDKEIVRLRLQKHLTIQKDPNKDARIEFALKLLGGLSLK